MSHTYAQEIAANLERADMSIQAARDLIMSGYFDFAASRAYYAAFYAATAVLLFEDVEFSNTETSDEDTDADADTAHAQEVSARYCAACASLYHDGASACTCDRRDIVREDARALLSPRTYLGKIHKCPACEGIYGGGLEVVTPLRSATMVSINILVEGIFQHLMPEQRRLLIFCDNRQDTAFQSAHLNHKHAQFIGRQLIYQVLCDAQAGGNGPVSFERLQNLLYERREQYAIYCPKPVREADGRLTYEIRKPENPDDVAHEYADIQIYGTEPFTSFARRRKATVRRYWASIISSATFRICAVGFAVQAANRQRPKLPQTLSAVFDQKSLRCCGIL